MGAGSEGTVLAREKKIWDSVRQCERPRGLLPAARAEGQEFAGGK